jgi:hypothetical protein
MKGLEKYMEKHGDHFTVELVNDILPVRWNSTDVISVTQKRVWYNVTSATIGDMVYLMNAFYHMGYPKSKCVLLMLDDVEDYIYGGKAFSSWVSSLNSDFDLTPYI